MTKKTSTKKVHRREARDRARSWLWLSEAQVAMGWFMVLGLAALLGTIYLSQASRIATTGRRMQELQAQLDDLKRQNAELERDIAGAQALDRLRAGAERLGFEPADPDDLEYIVVSDYPIAPPAKPTPVPTPAPPIETVEEALWLSVTTTFDNLLRGESREP